MSNSKINVDLATLNEINDFLYAPYFKDDIKGIRDFAEAYSLLIKKCLSRIDLIIMKGPEHIAKVIITETGTPRSKSLAIP